MNHDPHKLFPRLVAVGSSNQQRRNPLFGLPRKVYRAQAEPFPSQVVRMAVMPTLSRNLLFVGAAWIWKFVRGYFVNPRPGGAVVLSFPQSGFVSKKASGSVGWTKGCGTAPQEGGRA